MEKPDLIQWLALSDKKGLIAPSKVERIFNEYRSLAPLWNASPKDLQEWGLTDSNITGFLKYRNYVANKSDYQRIIDSSEKTGVTIIRYVDKEYPQLLRSAEDHFHAFQDPPLVLFHKGTLFDFENCVGIVGTRECSLYGHIMARRLGRAVARLGYTVVSGLARGVDTEAHCGALEVPGGKTVSILAWMNPVYPAENTELSNDIAARGALLSERYLPGTKFGTTAPGNFVERNRIISGISRCIIAVESGPEGGSVHQARIARAQGRKVFVVKPKKGNKRALEGFKLLTSEGATPVDSVKPVAEYLRSSPTGKIEERKIDSFYQNTLQLSMKK
jgi:DNA processing protein